MMPKERLGLLPKLLAVAEVTEVPSPPMDLERLAEQSLDEGLMVEELSKEDFGSVKDQVRNMFRYIQRSELH